MWVMFLNDMRSPKIEILKPVCRAETKEQLIDLLKREEVEPYQDDIWGKCYRKGGPLEWFNGPYDDDRLHFRYAGRRQEWMENAGMEYDREIMSLPVL